MAAAHKTNDDADLPIHRMETVPPPAGEDDAYNAATKIGPMARGLVEAMMKQAQVEEDSTVPPPASFTRGVTIPKAGRVPAAVAAPRPHEVQRLYNEGDEGDLFDPTALFGAPGGNPALAGGTVRIENHAVRSILDEIDGRRVAALPLRSDAEWTKAPTLMAMSVAPLPPPTELAALLEPAPAMVKRAPRSTLPLEIAIFVGTFLLIAIPAALAYLRWMR